MTLVDPIGSTLRYGLAVKPESHARRPGPTPQLERCPSCYQPVPAGPRPAVHVDAVAGVAIVNGRRVELSRLDRGLLLVLRQRAGQTVSSQELLERVWGVALHAKTQPDTRMLRAAMTRLRRRLAAAGAPGIIAHAPGRGYRLETLEA